jgi:hypothetical protein
MVKVSNIITVGAPSTPMNEVRLTRSVEGSFALKYRPVQSVVYIVVDNPYYWEDDDAIVLEKRYSIQHSYNHPKLEFYRPEKNHGNTRKGRCACDQPECGELGLWGGTPEQIVAGDPFQEILKERVEYLAGRQDKKIKAKAKRLAWQAENPIEHENRKKAAKEKRLAKQAESPIRSRELERQRHQNVTAGSLGVTEIH